MKKSTFKPVFEDEALIKVDSALPTTTATDEAFLAATKTGDWLPRLQLMTANSEKVKSGEFPMNSFALVVGQTMQNLGKELDVLVCAWRPKAIEMGDEVITVFDISNPEFIRIQEKSAEKESGCMYGPEFLVWIPGAKKFATYFLGSKSSRREAPGVKARMLKAATLKSHTVKTAKYTWQVPIATPCSTPFEMPDEEDLHDEMQKFANPPKSTVEKADASEQSSRAR